MLLCSNIFVIFINLIFTCVYMSRALDKKIYYLGPVVPMSLVKKKEITFLNIFYAKTLTFKKKKKLCKSSSRFSAQNISILDFISSEQMLD